MNRRDFLKLASKTLGLLGIAPIFGLPEAARKPEPLPGGVFLENNTPIGIVTAVEPITVTAEWFPALSGDALEYHGPSGIWINSTPYNSLAEAVKVAKTGDTIKLANGTFYTTDVVIPLGVTIEAINSTLIGEKGEGLIFELY